MVIQETHLFTGTIADNIRYGNPHATDEEVVEAAKIANADSFIKWLPGATIPCSTPTAEIFHRGRDSSLP